MPGAASRITHPVEDHSSERSRVTPDSYPRYSLPQLLLSRCYACRYHLEKRLAWSRGPYRERPAEQLRDLSGIQQERIASLKRRFRVRFEQRVEQGTALKQYDYLDILAQAWSAWKLPHSTGVSSRISGRATSGTPPFYTSSFALRRRSASNWMVIGFPSTDTVVWITRMVIFRTCRTRGSSSATMPVTIIRLTS